MNEQSITAKQVEEFMRVAAARLAEACGQEYAVVAVSFNHSTALPEWKSYAHTGHHITGPTCAFVIDAQVDEADPKARAARMRAEAEDLLAEAAKLEATT